MKLNRREYLHGLGLGSIALASLLAQENAQAVPVQSGFTDGTQAASLRIQGQERHFSVHGGRRQPSRDIRL